MCYALGGYSYPSHLSQTLCASKDELFRNVVTVANTKSHSNGNTQSAWKALPDTPTYWASAAILDGNLFAIGGDKTSEGGAAKKEIYVYSHSACSWICTSELPAPQSLTAVNCLSSKEILVIGGQSNSGLMNGMYKGSLEFNLWLWTSRSDRVYVLECILIFCMVLNSA